MIRTKNKSIVKLCKLIFIIFVAVLLVLPSELTAQFYNGHQVQFGKNRVQYNDFYWEYYRFPRYDTYFYLDGKTLARYTSKVIDEELKNLEDFFSHSLDNRIIFLIYNKQSEFKQSNIGLVSGNDETNIGGSSKIIDNKVFIYYNGNHRDFVKQIRAAIAEVILTDILYGGSFRQKVSSSTLLTLPDWYYKGLISYLSESWNFTIENKIKDALENGKLKKFNHLQDEDAVYAGHAIWYFVAQNYGTSVISDILYLTRVNKNVESGFLFVLGTNMKSLTPVWLDFYKTRFEKDHKSTTFPEGGNIKIKTKKNRVYQYAKLSPDSRFLAYTSNYSGKRHIWLYDMQKDKRKKIIRFEHRLKQITDYSYPVITWHPTGKILAFVAEVKGRLVMYFYFVETGKIQKRNIPYYDKILDFAYSHDGLNMAFSGVMKGQTDLFVYNLSAGSSEQITNDAADELHPRFAEQSSKIIFVSNRLSDTLAVDKSVKPEVMPTYDLFVYDFKTKSQVLQRITNTPYSDETSPEPIKKNTYAFLSDQNGVINRFLASYDSTISYIDTVTHFRYYTTQYPISNYNRNIEYYSVNEEDNALSEVLFNDRKDRIMVEEFNTKSDVGNGMHNTVYRNERTKEFKKKDSLILIQKQKIIRQREIRDSLAANNLIMHPDSVPLDINYYVFEVEKENPYHLVYGTDSSELETEKDTIKWPEQKIYLTSFYPNEMVTQIDFGFLNDMYQAYSPGAYYFNPGLNIFTKIGISDLFEDYKLTGGFRIAGNFDSFEYLLSLEDLKNRWDKQYIYHRLSVINYYNDLIAERIITNEIKAKLSYPFNQVSSVRGTVTFRSDRSVILSTRQQTLPVEDFYRYLGGVKLEYIFDNTIERGINLFNGIRFKAFAEYFQDLQKGGTSTYIYGADFRFYLPIHRNLIFAGRVASSASFGSGKLIYYLGGVDNWINFSTDIPTFDQSVRIDETENYIFQAVATDMRGFVQNARNGNKFVIANAEVRWPIVKYLINRPMNNAFLENLQVVGFTDVGSAWSGLSPWEKDNAYNTKIINGNPIRVIIDKKRSPFIVGYGFGLRSKLFGYFVRTDWAWGIDNNVILPRVFYFSLSLDF
ncbi:MAG: hypothetical protein P1P88_08390 [Bacteroidales bacterium]|nr:hypothetical protein [Bacteroidales bacterium]